MVIKLSKIWVWDPGPGKNLFRIPDPGVRKAPDPGSGSATLLTRLCFTEKGCFFIFLLLLLVGNRFLGIRKDMSTKEFLQSWGSSLLIIFVSFHCCYIRIRTPSANPNLDRAEPNQRRSMWGSGSETLYKRVHRIRDVLIIDTDPNPRFCTTGLRIRLLLYI
jgi:hypothetical protein